MPREILQMVNVGDVSDGYVGRAVNDALERVFKDIDDRGHDGLTRTVKIELKISKVANDRIEIVPVIDCKIPPHKPSRTVAKMDVKAGGFSFNPDMSDNPDQTTFADNKTEE